MRELFALLVLSAALLTTHVAASTGVSQQAETAPASGDYVFPSGAGALFLHVKPDRTEDFEAVIATLAGVLDRETDPIRRQQAASWRIYRSTEAPRDVAIYVFFFDPAVLGADYDPIKVLREAMPADLQSLYDRLRADVVRVERMGLAKMR
jgi:hypothetical protein